MRRSRTKKTGRFGLVMDPQMRVAIEGKPSSATFRCRA